VGGSEGPNAALLDPVADTHTRDPRRHGLDSVGVSRDFNFRLDALMPLILTVLVEAGIWYCFRNSGKPVLAEYAFRDLNLLCGMLAQIETQQFTTPYLQLLQSEMRSGAVTASRAMAASAGSSIGRNRSAIARPRPRGT
jgi:hypothetical protein